MDAVRLIKRLGWDWREDGLGMGLGPGVVLNVDMGGGQILRAFVPLSHVWLSFDQELQSVGCVGTAWVGAPYSVGGFFSSITHAVKSVAKAATSVVPAAVKNAATSVINTAKNAGAAALNAVNSVPILGTLTKASAALALLPAGAAQQILQGKRLDQVALDRFKTAVSSAQALAPFVQTVVSFVPGIGQGVSAGIGGGLALAQGQSITEAMIAAAKAAVPGGPLAQAALSVAADAMQGKPLNTILVNALPISQQAKNAIIAGVGAAKDLAAGKQVFPALLDAATKSLPPEMEKGLQIGIALGHAKNLQQAAGAAVQGAQHLVSASNAGAAAAQAFAQGVRTPAVLSALNTARTAQNTLATIVSQAQQGHPQAASIVNAVQMLKGPAPTALRAPTAPTPASVFSRAAPSIFANLVRHV